MDVAGEAATPIGRNCSEERLKLRGVGVEVRRSGAITLLIEIGSGRNVSRPSHRYVQSDPSHDRSRKRSGSEFRDPLSGH
jgi:hypothetical protein